MKEKINGVNEMAKAETRALIKALEIIVELSPTKRCAKKKIKLVRNELKEKEPTGNRPK